MHVSLDGFVADSNEKIDWISVDKEMFEDVNSLVKKADTAIYGRGTFQIMDSYWPTAADHPKATKHDKDHSRWYKSAKKIVFSKTLNKSALENTTFIKNIIKEDITKLKNQAGKDIVMFASPGLASQFMNLNLIDEFWFNINPAVLGSGKPLFKDIKKKHNLSLISTKKYKSGVVLVRYKVKSS